MNLERAAALSGLRRPFLIMECLYEQHFSSTSSNVTTNFLILKERRWLYVTIKLAD